MTWHPAYVSNVLAPDYDFADRNLLPHLLDSLTAHVRTVGRLPRVQEQPEALAATQRLADALARLHGQRLPLQAPEVPDAYFAVNRLLETELGEETVSYL